MTPSNKPPPPERSPALCWRPLFFLLQNPHFAAADAPERPLEAFP